MIFRELHGVNANKNPRTPSWNSLFPPTGDTTDVPEILLAMDAIELWDRKQKQLKIADFVNDLLVQFNSIKNLIKKILAPTTDNNSTIEPAMLELMAHAFGLKIEYEWKME